MTGELGTILRQLRFALVELDQELQRQLLIEQDSIAAQRRQKVALEQNIPHFNEIISELKSRKSFLDTEHLEILSTEGESRKEHKRHGLHRTPDFELSLKTAFPIRHFSNTSSEPETAWKHLLCELGSYTFSAKVKTRPFKDAWVAVMLQGWRKEIHADEIQSINRRLDDLKKKHHDASTRAKSTDQQISLSQEKLASIHDRRQTCSLDLVLVDSVFENPSDCNPLVHSLSDLGSISSVASLLGLGSMVEMEDAEICCFVKPELSPLESDWILVASGATEKIATQVHESNLCELSALDEYGSSLQKALTATVDILRSDNFAKLLQDNSSPGLPHNGTRDIEKLQESAGAIQRNWKAALEEMKDLYDEDDARLKTSIAASKENRGELQNDSKRVATVGGSINILPCPIGVSAAGMGGKTAAATWMSIYQGLQIEELAQTV